jgi:hypothetical protein
MTTLPIETARTASDDLPLEKALVEAMAEEMGKSPVWDQGYESMLPSERQKAPKTAASYLDMFFKEKRIPSKTFDVTDSQGITHSIPNQVVIDMIKQTRGRERSSIEDTLRKIDYGNGDVNHFLAHLAEGLAESYSGALRLASEQEAEKLQAEAEANEQQAQADRAKAEAAQMREASFPHFLARDVSRKLDAISVSLIEDDYVFILDPQKKLDSRRLMEGLQEGVATELSERSVSRDNPGGDVINDKDIDLDVEWSEDIEDDTPGWEVRFSQGNRRASREASGGLYGYTKGTQRDVEASVRKAQRRALSVAKTLYAKDERSVDFLKAHAKRANSKTARLILSAMKVLGPRVASDKTARLEVWEVLPQLSTSQNTALDELDADLNRAGLDVTPDGNKMTLAIKGPAAKIKKVMDATRYKVKKVASERGKTAGSGAANAKYLDSLPPAKKAKILKHIAEHYGVSVREIEDELTDRDAEALYEYAATDRAMAMDILRGFKQQRLASDKTAMLPSERHASIFHGSEKEQLEYVVDALRLAGEQGLRVDSLPRQGALAAQSKGFADAERGQLFITSKGKGVRLASYDLPVERAAAHVEIGKAEMDALHKDGKAEVGEHTISFKAASEEKIAGGLYGHPTKTARLALVACSDLRAYVGEVAYSLHSRRTAKYAKVTGFLKEHGKTSKCAYSRMILDCYPDAPVAKQASMTPASEMLKKAFVPDSVDGWLEWADGTRTAAHKEA